MKKLFIVMFVVALAACGGKKNTPAKPDPMPAGGSAAGSGDAGGSAAGSADGGGGGSAM
jgi:hypothetical protein